MNYGIANAGSIGIVTANGTITPIYEEHEQNIIRNVIAELMASKIARGIPMRRVQHFVSQTLTRSGQY